MCPRPVACLVRCAPLSERGRVQHMLAASERQSGWGHGDVAPRPHLAPQLMHPHSAPRFGDTGANMQARVG